MNNFRLVLILLLALPGCSTNSHFVLKDEQNITVGQKKFITYDAKRNRKISTYIWYPTLSQQTVEIGGGPFLPVVISPNAPIRPSLSKYPVALISHGSGGNAQKMFWMTEALVKKGFVVLGVDHPGNMIRDNSPRGVIEVWERARDLSMALDQLLGDSFLKGRLDISRIAAIGHSAGGTTALLLAGARFDISKFSSPIPHCKGAKDPYFVKICNGIEKLDLSVYKKSVIEGDYSDNRVSVSISFDPGFAKSFNRQSLKNLKNKSFVIVAEKLNRPQEEIYSKDFLKLMAPGQVEIMPDSIHMSFLQPCKHKLQTQDRELQELCAENDKKIQIQTKTVNKTIKFLSADTK